MTGVSEWSSEQVESGRHRDEIATHATAYGRAPRRIRHRSNVAAGKIGHDGETTRCVTRRSLHHAKGPGSSATSLPKALPERPVSGTRASRGATDSVRWPIVRHGNVSPAVSTCRTPPARLYLAVQCGWGSPWCQGVVGRRAARPVPDNPTPGRGEARLKPDRDPPRRQAGRAA
jgi:hypothetical protein